jgi:PPP family 3-phenylpropionic acid transporter
LIEERGIAAEQIGILFAAGTAIRLISAPLAGRIADRMQALRLTLAVCAIATGLAALGYLGAWSFWAILAVTLVHAFALAPTTNLADALALVASRRGQGFEYGWVRGAGSAAFVVGSILAGWATYSYGLEVILWLQALLMLMVPFAARWVPPVDAGTTQANGAISRTGVMALVRLPVFRRVVLVAALILGSHAMHDTFAVIRWRAAGISPQTVSLLWSLSVAAEVVVFFLIGPWLVHRLTPAGAIALAALAAAMRWLVAAFTADVAVVHAVARRLRACATRRDRPGHLRDGGHRRGDRAADAGLWLALWADGCAGIRRHERAVPGRPADRGVAPPKSIRRQIASSL